jgi:hypothetical protein
MHTPPDTTSHPVPDHVLLVLVVVWCRRPTRIAWCCWTDWRCMYTSLCFVPPFLPSFVVELLCVYDIATVGSVGDSVVGATGDTGATGAMGATGSTGATGESPLPSRLPIASITLADHTNVAVRQWNIHDLIVNATGTSINHPHYHPCHAIHASMLLLTVVTMIVMDSVQYHGSLLCCQRYSIRYVSMYTTHSITCT